MNICYYCGREITGPTYLLTYLSPRVTHVCLRTSPVVMKYLLWLMLFITLTSITWPYRTTTKDHSNGTTWTLHNICLCICDSLHTLRIILRNSTMTNTDHPIANICVNILLKGSQVMSLIISFMMGLGCALGIVLMDLEEWFFVSIIWWITLTIVMGIPGLIVAAKYGIELKSRLASTFG